MQPPHSSVSLLLVQSISSHGGLFESLHLRDLKSRNTANLGARFLQVAAARWEAPIVSTPDACFPYSSLAAAALNLGQYVKTQEADAWGDRVILLLPNSPEYIAAFYGVLLTGGVAVPLSPRMESETLRRIVEATKATQIITTADILRTRQDLQGLPADHVAWQPDGRTVRPGSPPVTDGQCDDRLAAIFFTGGSSGTPKGVMLSHRNLISNAESIQQYLEITPADNPSCILPFMHAFGNSVLQSHVLAGARLTLCGYSAFPQTIIDGIAEHQCTSLSGVPDLFRTLLARTSLGDSPLPNLRYMAVAGGALPQDLVMQLAEKIKPGRVFVMYGQTEATARLAYVPPEQLFERPDGAIGKPVPGVTLEVVDEHGVSVAQGDVGELRASGPNIMLGYWADPEETRSRVRDGWLYTGDLASRNQEGWLILRGRMNSFVKISGFRVHPQELEEFAVRAMGANQAVAVPFEGTAGTRLALFLRFKAEQPPAASTLIATCRSALPHYLVPESIQLVDEFPLNHAMKIDRLALVETISQRRTSA